MTYALHAVVWSLVGLASGYTLRGWRDARQPVPAERTPAMMTERARRAERRLAAAVVVLAILMGAQYVYLLSGVRQRAECESDERARVGQLSDENQNRLILGVARLVAAPEPAREPTAAERAKLAQVYRKLFSDFTTQANAIALQRQRLVDGEVCD